MANSDSGDSMTERIVRVLETFSATRTMQTASEIGRRASLPPSTAHRIVDDLVQAGLLERDEDRRVRLGLRLWELGLRGSHVLRLRQAAMAPMERVQAALREHTQLAVLEQDEALFLERLSHPQAGANITRVAGRLPLNASSSGLVLWANADAEVRERILAAPMRALTPATPTDPDELRRLLTRVRRQGYVIAPGTVDTVSTGVAVPIRYRGDVVAALSVVLPRDTAPEPAVATLRGAARETEQALAATR